MSCIGKVSQRGTIHCDDCIENRKNISLAKRQTENDILLQTLHALQKEYETSVAGYETKIKLLTVQATIADDSLVEHKKTQEENFHLKDYNTKLENETHILQTSIETLRKENFKSLQEKIEFERTHSQILLDNEKLKVELKKLNDEIIELKREVEYTTVKEPPLEAKAPLETASPQVQAPVHTTQSNVAKAISVVEQHLGMNNVINAPPRVLTQDEKDELAVKNKPVVDLRASIIAEISDTIRPPPRNEMKIKKVSDFKHTVKRDIDNRQTDAQKKPYLKIGDRKLSTSLIKDSSSSKRNMKAMS